MFIKLESSSFRYCCLCLSARLKAVNLLMLHVLDIFNNVYRYSSFLSSTIRRWSLEDNGLDSDCLVPVIKVLKNNIYITSLVSLDLEDNGLDSDGLIHVINVLKNTIYITSLVS